MEHKLITGGGEHWLAFARSKIKGLRNSALQYGTQKYTMPDGAEVEVRLVGEMEYIRITASDRWDYLTWPTSTLTPEGLTSEVSGALIPTRSAMTLTKGSRKVQEKTGLKSARFDWLSYDGFKDGAKQYGKVCLSYDHGHQFRYEPAGAGGAAPASRNIYRDGKTVKTAYGVKGCAYHAASKRIIYVWYEYVLSLEYGYETVATELVVGYLDEGNRDENGQPATVEIKRKVLAFPDVIAQPTYFDGSCSKFVSATETIQLTVSGPPGSLPLVQFVAPRKFINGKVLYNADSGQFDVEFELEEILISAPTDVSTLEEDPPGYQPSMAGQNVTLNKTFFATGGPPDPLVAGAYPGTSGYDAVGQGTSTRTRRSFAFYAVDMSADGERLLIQRTLVNRDQYTGHSIARSYNSSVYVVTQVGVGQAGPIYGITITGTIDNTFTDTSTTTNSTLRGFAVNDVIVDEVSTYDNIVTANFVGAVHIDIVFPGTPVQGTPTLISTPGGRVVYRDVSVRDIDMRYNAIAVVEGERNAVMSSTVPPPGFPPLPQKPYKTTLRAKFMGEEHKKVIFDGTIAILPNTANIDTYVYRAIASRRPGEYVISLTAHDNAHGVTGIGTYYQRLDLGVGTIDRSPLLIAMRKGVESPLPPGFKLGGEPDFALQPVQLL